MGSEAAIGELSHLELWSPELVPSSSYLDGVVRDSLGMLGGRELLISIIICNTK